MSIYEHVSQFAGKPVIDWSPEPGIQDPIGTIYRIALTWDDSEDGVEWTDRFAQFLQDPAAGYVTGLVVGSWGGMGGESSEPIVQALVAARDRLPQLTALFLGDIISEENEISWIVQTDVSALIHAYPGLEHFRVRGSERLNLGRLRHERLKELAVESGGLPAGIVHQIFSSELPALEHLEIWFGDEGYGADTTVEDLAPILSGQLFPNLTYLGLRNSAFADAIAGVIVNAPVLTQLSVLDLSLGTLTDEGAAVLLGSPAIRRLKKLDIHHHYCSPETVEAFHQLGIEVDAGDAQSIDRWNGEEHRFVAVSE